MKGLFFLTWLIASISVLLIFTLALASPIHSDPLELARQRIRNANPVAKFNVGYDYYGNPLAPTRILQEMHADRADSVSFVVYGVITSTTGASRNVSEFQITFENPSALDKSVDVAKAAIQVVANNWISEIPVKALIHFGSTLGFLAYGTPTGSYKMNDVWYTPAIYDYITGKDNNNDAYDVDVEFDVSRKWYVSTEDSPPSDAFDFQSVLIHEMQHGLFMVSNYEEGKDGEGMVLNSGLPTVFDQFVVVNPVNQTTANGVCGVIGYFNGSTETSNEEVQLALTSNRLFFQLESSLGSGLYNLYAPGSFVQGSSVIHQDAHIGDQSEMDRCDELMFYQINRGQILRCLGKVTKRISSACRLSAIEEYKIEVPAPCVPGTFGKEPPAPEEDDEIAGLPTAAFIAIVASIGCVVLLFIACIIGMRFKASKKHYHPEYFETSTPTGQYRSPDYGRTLRAKEYPGQMELPNDWYVEGVASPSAGGGADGGMHSPSYGLMSPSAMRSVRGSRAASPGVRTPSGRSHGPGPRGMAASGRMDPKMSASGRMNPQRGSPGGNGSGNGSRNASRPASGRIRPPAHDPSTPAKENGHEAQAYHQAENRPDP